MHKILLAACAVVCFGALAAPAHATPTITTPSGTVADPTAAPADLPYRLAQLQNEISTLQTQVKTLQSGARSVNGAASSDASYDVDDDDISAIPSGG